MAHRGAAGHLDQGYALAAHLAQGSTVDRAFVLGSDELYREWGYTALSRHWTKRASTSARAASSSTKHRRRCSPAARSPGCCGQAGLSGRRAKDLAGRGIDPPEHFARWPERPPRPELMTACEVAALLEVPISTVLEWGRNGTLPRVKLGRHVGFIRAHVEAAILDREDSRRV